MAAASPDLGTGPTNQQGPSPQTGSTTPTGQVIGPLPASTMPGQLAQAIPTMANFQYLLAVDQNLQNQINNIGTGTGSVTEVDTQAPILGGPITSKGTISHATSGVVPGTYGNSTNVAVPTVDQFGHITNIVNVPITGTGGSFIQADYVVYPATNGGLTNQRLLTAGTNITITDGGAGGAVTINAATAVGSTLQSKEFIGAGTYTFNVPAGVSAVWLKMVGAGAAGGGLNGSANGGGGGGAGETCENLLWPVTPGGTATVIIGAGGVAVLASNGGNGGDTSFNNGTLTALVKGGLGGAGNTGIAGGVGGGPRGAVSSNSAGIMGTAESPCHFGGAGGGGGANGASVGSTGGPAGGVLLGAAGGAVGGGKGGGGGGASTIWGLGSPGAAGTASGTAATNYGTGGGGAGGTTTNTTGGNGADGYALVSWVS